MPKKQNLTNEPKKELARAIKEKKLKLQQEEKQRIENQHRREKDGTAMREKGVLEATASQGPHGNGWLDGFQRAKLAKECRDKFSLPKIQECEALPCINSELKMVYMLVSKAGSSTLREAVKPFVGYQKATSTAWSDQYTWFTEVRDPLSRAVSSFLEEGHACRQNNFQGLEKGFQGTLKNPNGSALALAIFESWIANLEKGLCWGGHSRPQLCRIPIPGKYFNIERSMDYVGLLDHLDEDWKVMGAFQEKVFGVSLPVLPKPQRVKPHSVVSLLNVGVLPKSLKQRICTLFKVDYCCFRMKVPQACKIEC